MNVTKTQIDDGTYVDVFLGVTDAVHGHGVGVGFIKFDKMEGARKQLAPKLSFEYDIIRVKSKIEEIFPLSEKSNRGLLTAQVG